MSREKIVIEIPMLPGKELSPNWRGHWTGTYRARIELMEVMRAMARKYSPPLRAPPLRKAKVSITYIVKENRARDVDNWLAMAKPILDVLKPESYSNAFGIGIIEDDRYEMIGTPRIRFIVDKERAPMTIVEIEDRSNER